jgi:hypothetical protein
VSGSRLRRLFPKRRDDNWEEGGGGRRGGGWREEGGEGSSLVIVFFTHRGNHNNTLLSLIFNPAPPSVYLNNQFNTSNNTKQPMNVQMFQVLPV